jgi:hypothetical protein
VDARVEAIAGETPYLPVSFGSRLCVGAQASFSIADPSQMLLFGLCFSADRSSTASKCMYQG